MTAAEILAALENVSFEVPAAALQAAEEQPAAVADELLKAVEQAANDPAPLLENHQYQRHIYALYLLAKARDVRAYPHVLKLFGLPDEATLDLTGDVAIEDGPLLLASVCDGDVEPIKRLVENESAQALVRSAAIAALAVLYSWGERTREEVIAYYRRLFHGTLPRPGNPTVWAGLLTCCYHVQAQELADEIRAAYVNQLAPGTPIPFPEMEAGLMGARPHMAERFIRRYRPIQSTAESIAWWRCFQMGKPAAQPAPAATDGEARPARRANPYAHLSIGRNDPCPCGSGRKYKKCCGA